MKFDLHHLADDGRIPNNPHLPLIVYHDVFSSGDGPDVAIERFRANGWGGHWINGIYEFHHYHARAHEVLANVGAPVEVQFGGRNGPVVEFSRGAVVVIPAGVGHCRRSRGTGLVIVGAYPNGQEDWDLKRETPDEYAKALAEIPDVPLPEADPVSGPAGVLIDAWGR